MTETSSPALRTWLAYYQAWTSHDLDTAMSYIADDIVFQDAVYASKRIDITDKVLKALNK